MNDRRLPGFAAASAPGTALLGWVVLIALPMLLLGALPAGLLVPGAEVALATIGLVGLWRWGWGGVHMARAWWWRRCAFPPLRVAAAGAAPPALFVIVTSYRMDAGQNAAVYGRLLEELAAFGMPAQVVAAVSDAADAHLLEAIFARHAPALAEGSALHLVAQDGTGKRAALVEALRVVRAQAPPPHAQLVLMDGDTLLQPGTLAGCARVLAAFADLGAVTCDNRPLVRGGAATREWYRLRMAQRDVLMCSVSLSRRLLVLTGRFSIFRMQAALEPGFALALGRDSFDHWRLGRIGMVTGDDKSTWFATLSGGWRMLYVPDMAVDCLEELPRGGWARATTALMLRWYGNMARGNARALALGPRRIGWFPWLCLLDQRLSPWTTLMGPLVVGIVATAAGPAIIAAYALWVVATRTLATALTGGLTGRFHPLFPFLLYYGQVAGALIKIFVFHNPDRQGWNRQKLGAAQAADRQRQVSMGYFAASLAAFVLVVLAVSGAVAPDAGHGRPVGLDALLDRTPHPDDHLRVPCGQPRAAPCAAVVTAPRADRGWQAE